MAKNVDINKMFNNQSGTDNIEIHNHNLNDGASQEEILQNMNVITNKFKSKLNKNPQDEMTVDVVTSFLDSCLVI